MSHFKLLYLARVDEGETDADDLWESELELLDPPAVPVDLQNPVTPGRTATLSSLEAANIPSPGDEQ